MTDRLKLAVLGSPIAHSRSPMLQSLFARECGIDDFSYERIETTEETLHATVSRLILEGYDGFNCTMPLKTEMAKLSDTLEAQARALCSVNTVTIRGAKLHGATTDGDGIILTVRRALREAGRDVQSLIGKRVMLLGAGGAARSVALSLYNAGAKLTVLNRTDTAAKALAQMLGAELEILPLEFEALISAAKSCDILINCTSLGMSSQGQFESLEFIDHLSADAIVIDAVYEPLETKLLERARSRGLIALGGLWMLVYQGALAFEKWTGVLPGEDTCQKAFDLIK